MLAMMLMAETVPALPLEWARFERAGALSHVAEVVQIATNGIDPKTHEIEIKLRYTTSHWHDSKTLWANSRTCPAIRQMLSSMRDLQMPRPAPYGVETGDRDIIVDGAGYALTAPSNFSDGQLTITSNVGSPLANWVDGAFTRLAPCWSPVELRVDPPR